MFGSCLVLIFDIYYAQGKLTNYPGSSGCQKIRPQEDSAQRRPAIFEKVRPRRREDSAPRLRRFGPPYAIVFLSVYFCNMFISFK